MESKIKVSIVIPTMKSQGTVEKQLIDIKNTITNDTYEYEVFSGAHINQSAAHNRNWCIDKAKGEVIIMMDDDMEGFYTGWADNLITPLVKEKEKYNILAARLVKRNGEYAPMLGVDHISNDKGCFKAIHTPQTGLNIVCSACISFWKTDGVRFDTDNFGVGACYEDSDLAMSFNKKFPDRCVAINNDCCLIHLGESKGRGSAPGKKDYWEHNKKAFAQKWGIEI